MDKAKPAPLTLFSIVIPARDEEDCIIDTIREINTILKCEQVPHEIVVVDDGSTDQTWSLLQNEMKQMSELAPVQNPGPHGYGNAVQKGLFTSKGDALAIMMGDRSDSAEDAVKYWHKLNEGYECVFGSRFIRGGAVYDYPKVKLIINRLANLFIKTVFRIKLNDTTNAFKAYRREVIEGCRPIIAPHFNLTVELPLKAIVRGYSWCTIPISWRNRTTGAAKLKIKEMGSRYFFIMAYIWLEKYFSKGDYHRESGN